MKISAVHMANLISYKDCEGFDKDKVEQLLKNPYETVDLANFIDAFETLIYNEQDEYLGLHCASILNLKAMEFVNLLTYSTSSIKQVIYIIQQYLENTFPLITLILIEKNEDVILRLEGNLHNAAIRKNIMDGAYYFIHRALLLMMGTSTEIQLELPYDDLHEYIKFLKQDVKTGEGYCFLFPKELLNKEINRKRAKEVEILLPEFLRLINKGDSLYQQFSLEVRNKILTLCSPQLPALAEVISVFNLGERTFQRKLAEENQTFRKIANDIKRQLSQYLSKGHKMKTQDIAFLLGYSDPSAYLHAVKKWNPEIERDLISKRTKEALLSKKLSGIRLGRPKGAGKSKLDIYRPKIEAFLKNGSTQKYIAKRYNVTEPTLCNWIKKNKIRDILKKN